MRDYLRVHPEVARRYGALKKSLAAQYPEDIDAYTEGKTEILLEILSQAGLGSDELDAIERINRRTV